MDMRNFVKGLVLSSLVAAVAFAAGCGGKKEPTCEAVVEHMLSLVKDTPQFKDAPAEMKKQITEMIDKEKPKAVEKCKSGEDKLDQKQMECVLAAKNVDEAEKCTKKPGDTATPPPAETPPPAPAEGTAPPPAEGAAPAPATPPAEPPK
jgi:hypothetical protein